MRRGRRSPSGPSSGAQREDSVEEVNHEWSNLLFSLFFLIWARTASKSWGFLMNYFACRETIYEKLQRAVVTF